MDKQDYRNQIDRIDEQIVKLFTERMGIAAKIGDIKKENNLPILDAKREREKLAAVTEMTPDELKDYTPLLYSMLFDLSRSYQARLSGYHTALTGKLQDAIRDTPQLFPEFASVACQGVEGANSQFACDKMFRHANIMYFNSFDAVFTSIEKGLCRYGVIPVENSTAGSVNTVYDLMMNHKFYIVRSLRLKVDHNLLVKPGTKLEDIREIYSHEQALSQCSDYLSTMKGVRLIPYENTATAAKMVAESGRSDIAAIASRPCMKYYALDCLKESIQNTDNNFTRFICISKDLQVFPGADRTSLMLTLPHEAGSLYKFLAKLYALDINLIKLESRPLPNRPFEFMFYFDFDTPVYSPRLQQLIGELPDICESFTYLGSYSEVV